MTSPCDLSRCLSRARMQCFYTDGAGGVVISYRCSSHAQNAAIAVKLWSPGE